MQIDDLGNLTAEGEQRAVIRAYQGKCDQERKPPATIDDIVKVLNEILEVLKKTKSLLG